jgi:hypothetical protein
MASMLQGYGQGMWGQERKPGDLFSLRDEILRSPACCANTGQGAIVSGSLVEVCFWKTLSFTYSWVSV